jgi:hypothetical protein
MMSKAISKAGRLKDLTGIFADQSKNKSFTVFGDSLTVSHAPTGSMTKPSAPILPVKENKQQASWEDWLKSKGVRTPDDFKGKARKGKQTDGQQSLF